MFVMVSYDIADDRRRRSVQKFLEGRGDRVQYSVFECSISEAQYADMKKQLADMIEGASDSVRFYLLCEACRKTIEFRGNGDFRDEENRFFIV
jgi:CRISPR-associated protein Cas2